MDWYRFRVSIIGLLFAYMVSIPLAFLNLWSGWLPYFINGAFWAIVGYGVAWYIFLKGRY